VVIDSFGLRVVGVNVVLIDGFGGAGVTLDGSVALVLPPVDFCIAVHGNT
jgi:hypothetical protein